MFFDVFFDEVSVFRINFPQSLYNVFRKLFAKLLPVFFFHLWVFRIFLFLFLFQFFGCRIILFLFLWVFLFLFLC
ncbi:MAG TPA: hypothetical protein ENF94_01030 [Candidatus Woesearchaeota archaeon]|nr:hypothetical protein [Candidatus Woesearchaeota archaeon]